MTDERSGSSGSDDLEKVINNFVSCGRCSFFLADYRARHGDDALRAAAQESEDRWLFLEWDNALRHVLQKSYGGRLDTAFYYYDGRCPECQRRFVYQAAGEEEEEAFKIRLKPVAGRGR